MRNGGCPVWQRKHAKSKPKHQGNNKGNKGAHTHASKRHRPVCTDILTFSLRHAVDENVAVVRRHLPRQRRGASRLLEGAAHHGGGLTSVLPSVVVEFEQRKGEGRRVRAWREGLTGTCKKTLRVSSVAISFNTNSSKGSKGGALLDRMARRRGSMEKKKPPFEGVDCC